MSDIPPAIHQEGYVSPAKAIALGAYARIRAARLQNSLSLQPYVALSAMEVGIIKLALGEDTPLSIEIQRQAAFEDQRVQLSSQEWELVEYAIERM